MALKILNLNIWCSNSIVLKELINEAKKLKFTDKKLVKFTGIKQPEHMKVLIQVYANFLNEYYNTDIKFTLNIKKVKIDGSFGHIDLIDVTKGKMKMYLQNMTLLPNMSHEFTHFVQIINGNLGFTDDNLYILWKGEKHISVEEYKNLTTNEYNIYKELPWEKQAIVAKKTLPKLFLKSKYMDVLRSYDNPTINYIMDNDGLMY